MAFILERPAGHKWLRYYDLKGERQTIKLGKINKETAPIFAGALRSC